MVTATNMANIENTVAEWKKIVTALKEEIKFLPDDKRYVVGITRLKNATLDF